MNQLHNTLIGVHSTAHLVQLLVFVYVRVHVDLHHLHNLLCKQTLYVYVYALDKLLI